ncbi:MAG: GTP-binding protein [Pirellulaceae bacterium]|nr:GTP-binding protein [Pirellulaceae bacterium]
MSKTISFVMIGGFLGAGKTTLIARLAHHYSRAGKKIAIVTNDQAFGLVDTEHLRSEGFSVGEVPGACFCCKFDDLVETAAKLSLEQLPDVLIAEPVGSCTDLMATVIEPMRQIYGDRFQVGPLTVLVKPEHGEKILSGNGKVGFSPKAAYIFQKQIEEANIVAINKIDKLSPERIGHLIESIDSRFPGKKIIPISGRSGENFDCLVSSIENPELAKRTFMDVDYDIYASGESELGWYNCQISAEMPAVEGGNHGDTGRGKFELDRLVLELIEEIALELRENRAEPVHLKILGQSKNVTESTHSAIANLVASDAAPELSLKSEIWTNSADLIVNARVATDPNTLEKTVKNVVDRLVRRGLVELSLTGIQAFQPGRPVPIHRMTQ